MRQMSICTYYAIVTIRYLNVFYNPLIDVTLYRLKHRRRLACSKSHATPHSTHIDSDVCDYSLYLEDSCQLKLKS